MGISVIELLPVGAPAAAGAAFLMWAGLLAVLPAPGGERCGVCPGPRRSMRERLAEAGGLIVAPWGMFAARPCGYPLDGLASEEDGAPVVCPECGTRVRRRGAKPARGEHGRRAIKRPLRLRRVRLGVTFLALAAMMYALPVIRSGAWVRYVPTTALVTLERLPHDPRLRPIRHELDTRVEHGGVVRSKAETLARILVEDLRYDDRAGNAARAERLLRELGPWAEDALRKALASEDCQQRRLAALLLAAQPGAKMTPDVIERLVESLQHDDIHSNANGAAWRLRKIGEPAIPALQRALSGDTQQRREAASILRFVDAPATPELLEASILDLADDGWGWNGKSAAVWLTQHAEAAEPLLAEAMAGVDAQQRMLAAFVAGYGERTNLIVQAAPILLAALENNDVRGDARLAAPALYRFGRPVIPHLAPYLASPDAQQREIVDLVLSTLTDPNPAPGERDRRERLRRRISRVSGLDADAWDAISGWYP